MAENLNINPANQISIQQIINNSNFAQFLSEHLSHNNVSQSEITNLLNLFSRQLNLQQNQNNNNNNNNSLHELGLSNISIISHNNSIILDSNILSDVSEAPIINNNIDPAPGLLNSIKKEYDNGTY